MRGLIRTLAVQGNASIAVDGSLATATTAGAAIVRVLPSERRGGQVKSENKSHKRSDVWFHGCWLVGSACVVRLLRGVE